MTGQRKNGTGGTHEPRGLPLSSSRQDRADAGIIVAAKELAPLVINLLERTEGIHGTTQNIVRAKALAAQIQGLSGAKVEAVRSEVNIGSKVLINDLVKDDIYITHFPGRDLEWSFVALLDDDPFDDFNNIKIKIGKEVMEIHAADYGLAPYGGVNSSWIPNVWTERTGVNLSDGKNIMKEIELGQVDELPDDEDIV